MAKLDQTSFREPLERWSAVELLLSPSSVIPDIGMSLLDAGYDTPEIIHMAVSEKDDDPADLSRAASRAFRSIGVNPEVQQFHEIVIGRGIASRIVCQQLEAEAGLDEMLHMWRVTNRSDLFTDWMLLDESIYLIREGDGYGGIEPFHMLSEGSICDTIVELAQKFLDSHTLPVL